MIHNYATMTDSIVAPFCLVVNRLIMLLIDMSGQRSQVHCTWSKPTQAFWGPVPPPPPPGVGDKLWSWILIRIQTWKAHKIFCKPIKSTSDCYFQTTSDRNLKKYLWKYTENWVFLPHSLIIDGSYVKLVLDKKWIYALVKVVLLSRITQFFLPHVFSQDSPNDRLWMGETVWLRLQEKVPNVLCHTKQRMGTSFGMTPTF